MEQFLRELVPDTFCKCFEDHAVFRWTDNIQNDVLEMAVALMTLLNGRLAVVGAAPADADEEDLVPLLSALAPVFDPDSPFHVKHRLDALPARAAKMEFAEAFAQPQPEVDEALTVCAATLTRAQTKLAAGAPAPPDRARARSRAASDPGTSPVAPQENAAGQFEAGGRVHAHRWLTYIVNCFGNSGCFTALLQVRGPGRQRAPSRRGGSPLAALTPPHRAQLLEAPQRASLRTLEACLKALAKVRPRASVAPAARLAPAAAAAAAALWPRGG